MKESKFTKEVCSKMKNCGATIVPYVGNYRQQNGVPDRYVCHQLWQGWLEFKTTKGRLSTAQKIFIQRMNLSRKGVAFVVREPNIIENEKGDTLSHFANGFDLLLKLYHITENLRCR